MALYNTALFISGQGKPNPSCYWLTEQGRWSYLAHYILQETCPRRCLKQVPHHNKCLFHQACWIFFLCSWIRSQKTDIQPSLYKDTSFIPIGLFRMKETQKIGRLNVFLQCKSFKVLLIRGGSNLCTESVEFQSLTVSCSLNKLNGQWPILIINPVLCYSLQWGNSLQEYDHSIWLG